MEDISIIEKVTDLIMRQFPTYRPWAEAQALYLLSCATPRAYLPGGGWGLPLTFNVWAVGPSRIAFKSTPIREVTKRILREIDYPLIPPRFTTEKCIGYIAEKEIQHAALIRDETAGLVAETGKNYLADELSFLCELLDGDISDRMTYTHGLIKGREIRVNFMSACTPSIYKIIDETFWTQGLGSRLITIYWLPKEEIPINIDAEQDQWWYSKEIKEIAEPLKQHYELNVQRIEFSDYVASAYQKEEFVRRKKAFEEYYKDKTNILPSMYYELQVQLRRVAALHAIDRQLFTEKPIVEKEDWYWAKQWIEQRWMEFKILYVDWKESLLMSMRRFRGLTAKEMILARIRQYGGEVDHSVLLQNTNMRAEVLKSTIKDLIEEGKIQAVKVETASKPKTVYRLVEEDF